MKKETFSQDFNRLPAEAAKLLHPDEMPHSQEYALQTVEKWLKAALFYKKKISEDHSPANDTERAFAGGKILDRAIDMIDDGVRNTGFGAFDTKGYYGLPAPDEEIIKQNRDFFERWLLLKEQARHETLNPAVDKLLEAKQKFSKAWTHPSYNHRQAILNEVLEIVVDSNSLTPSSNNEASIVSVLTRKLRAHTLHDLADMGEFKNNGRAAKEMAIIGLWDCANEVNQIDDELLPIWFKEHYLSEIEYFRGKYSEEIGIDPDLDPRENTKQNTKQTPAYIH